MEENGSLKIAIWLTARRLCENALGEAIARYNSQHNFHTYGGEAHDFRRAKDGRIYHWMEFDDHYKNIAGSEWRMAEKIVNDDGSFIVPLRLLEQIESDL